MPEYRRITMKYIMSEMSTADLLAMTVREKHGDTLVSHFGSLRKLSQASVEDIMSLGVSKVTANKLLAMFEIAKRMASESEYRPSITCPQDVVALVRDIQLLDREVFKVVLLNTKHYVLGIHTVGIGCLDSCSAHPREVFKPAIMKSASSIICVHNHPGSLRETDPSQQDIELTKRLVDASKIIGIPVLDHIIIGASGSDNWVSLKSEGLMG
jgi:DNA repair protein RadC